MKYYEILYNSSQSSRTGGVGLGIRAVSENMPDEYLTAANVNEKYQSGKFRMVYPSELLADTSKILACPTQYSYRKTALADGKELYILRRCVPLGFDYAYYDNGNATRLGNYAEHTILFDERPDASIFGMLYEEPSEDSLFFRPLDRIPRVDNEELREMMLGKMADFKMADKNVATSYNKAVCDEAYNVFFNLIEARHNKQSLVVKVAEADKRIVMADVCRLMFDRAVDASFACSYTQSINPAIEITYVTEHNSAPSFAANPSYMHCDAADVPQTEAARKYLGKFKECMASNSTEGMKMSEWLLSGNYEYAAGADIATSFAFYDYLYVPERFSLDALNDKALVAIIVRYLSETRSQAALVHKLLKSQVCNAIEQQDDKKFVDALNHIKRIDASGIPTATVTADVKEACCDYMLESPQRVAYVYNNLSEESVFKSYAITDKFARKEEYIADACLTPQIMNLYRYFFKHPETDICHILTVLWNIDNKIVVPVLRDANKSDAERLSCYLRLMKERRSTADIPKLYNIALYDVGIDRLKRIDILKEFGNDISTPEFAPVFYAVLLNREQMQVRDTIAVSASLIRVNSAYKQRILEHEDKNMMYKRLFDYLLSVVDSKYASELREQIENDVIAQLKGSTINLDSWTLLSDMLKDIDSVADVKKVYELSLRIPDGRYLQDISYRLLASDNMTKDKGMTLLNNLKAKNCLDEKEVLSKITALKNQKTKQACVCAYLEVVRPPFKQALSVMKYLQAESAREILSEYYEKEYKKYLRNQRIKKFFTDLFRRSKNKKKENEETDK